MQTAQLLAHSRALVRGLVPEPIRRAVWKRLYFLFLYHLDEEVRAARKIIDATMRDNSISLDGDDPTTMDHQGNWVFLHRIRVNPTAFRMSFWQGGPQCEVEYLDSRPDMGRKILDFGCGSGHLDVLLARRGIDITGLDTSQIAIALADNLKMRQSPETSKRLRFFRCDITSPEVQAMIFRENIELVWSNHVFEHIANPIAVFDGLRNAVANDTPMLIVVPKGFAFDDPDHVHHWHSEKQFHEYLSQFVQVQSVKCDNTNHVLRAHCVLARQ